jgi:PAS domain S-box-containing protein
VAALDKVNILLVDDQPSKLLSYEVILDGLGENLLRATSGREALEHLLKTEIAIVLIDVCMPELDGFELAAMIREHPRCQNTAIIFISAIHLTDMDRMRGYEMGAVDYVPVPVVAEVLRAKVRIFADLYRKTRLLEQLNRDLETRVAERTSELESYAVRLQESESRRSLALAAGKMGSWDWDVIRGDCLWDEGQCRIFGVDREAFIPTAANLVPLIHPDDFVRLTQAWRRAAEGSERALEIEFRVQRPDGEQRWCIGTAAATVDSSGNIIRVSGITMDITDRKQAEDRHAHLAKEVDHRARNILAVVQSIVRLTNASTIKEYAAAVNGRIKALSIAHTLLSETRWQGADLRGLVEEELAPYRSARSNSVSTAGPDILLDHRCAQTIAMIIHELATNAAKHGSLSVDTGKVDLNWELRSDHINLRWEEKGGPPTAHPSSQGYGTRMVLAGLAQLGGEANFTWARGGLRCTLTVPYIGGLKANPATSVPIQTHHGDGRFNVLVVEDEPLVAMMMEDALKHLGYTVVGPFGSLSQAVEAARNLVLHGALLDVNIAGEAVYPVADVLSSRRVPYAFITGYAVEHVPAEYTDIPKLQKPIDLRDLQRLFPPTESLLQLRA